MISFKMVFRSMVLSALLMNSGAFAQESVGEATPSPEQGMAILKSMAEFLADADKFSVNMRIGYDVVQESGRKIEFGETRRVAVSRPERLRVDIEQSDGDKGLIVFDGKTINVFNEQENVFAKAPETGGIDGTIVHFVRDLQMRMPLAMLLVTTLPAEIDKRVRSVDYVEQNMIMNVPCDHLAVQTDTTDIQLWIAQGDQPLLRRVVITYKEAEAEPQFRADLTDWNLKPTADASLFTFTPPKGAEEIPFLATLDRKASPDQQTSVEENQGAKP